MHFCYSGENRKPSRPTLILQQLCLALLGYLIMLYVSEFLVDTKTGCIAVNILRYYFVMVSLLWNGLEGLNMYLMLVKVFKSHVRHFIIKSCLIAWGKGYIILIFVFIVFKFYRMLSNSTHTISKCCVNNDGVYNVFCGSI